MYGLCSTHLSDITVSTPPYPPPPPHPPPPPFSFFPLPFSQWIWVNEIDPFGHFLLWKSVNNWKTLMHAYTKQTEFNKFTCELFFFFFLQFPYQAATTWFKHNIKSVLNTIYIRCCLALHKQMTCQLHWKWHEAVKSRGDLTHGNFERNWFWTINMQSIITLFMKLCVKPLKHKSSPFSP